MDIGYRLRSIREQKNLSQGEIEALLRTWQSAGNSPRRTLRVPPPFIG